MLELLDYLGEMMNSVLLELVLNEFDAFYHRFAEIFIFLELFHFDCLVDLFALTEKRRVE